MVARRLSRLTACLRLALLLASRSHSQPANPYATDLQAFLDAAGELMHALSPKEQLGESDRLFGVAVALHELGKDDQLPAEKTELAAGG